MIRITEREPMIEERSLLFSDMDNILIQAGVPQRGYKRFSLVAEDNGRFIGYASGLADHLWLLLSDMWVHEDYRRRGIGTFLLESMEKNVKAAGLKHIYLWTYGPINPKFYEKNGYRSFTVFEDYYEVEGYNQIGYRKDL